MLGTAFHNQHAIDKHIDKVVGRRPMKSYGHVKSFQKRTDGSGNGDTSSIFFSYHIIVKKK